MLGPVAWEPATQRESGHTAAGLPQLPCWFWRAQIPGPPQASRLRDFPGFFPQMNVWENLPEPQGSWLFHMVGKPHWER